MNHLFGTFALAILSLLVTFALATNSSRGMPSTLSSSCTLQNSRPNIPFDQYDAIEMLTANDGSLFVQYKPSRNSKKEDMFIVKYSPTTAGACAQSWYLRIPKFEQSLKFSLQQFHHYVFLNYFYRQDCNVEFSFDKNFKMPACPAQSKFHYYSNAIIKLDTRTGHFISKLDSTMEMAQPVDMRVDTVGNVFIKGEISHISSSTFFSCPAPSGLYHAATHDEATLKNPQTLILAKVDAFSGQCLLWKRFSRSQTQQLENMFNNL